MYWRRQAQHPLPNEEEVVLVSGIMHRVALLVRGKAERVINDAEDPAEALDYAYQQAQAQLQEARAGLAKMATARERVVQQDQKLAQEEAQLTNQARRALGVGREDLAREAAQRVSVIRASRAPIQAQLEQLRRQQDDLEATVATMQQQIEALATKKEVLKAQFAAGTAASEVNDALAGIGSHMEDVSGAFTRAEDKVAQVTARADATHELLQSGALASPLGGGATDRIEAELASSGAGDVDGILEQFRTQPALPGASGPAALPPGTPQDTSSGSAMEGWR